MLPSLGETVANAIKVSIAAYLLRISSLLCLILGILRMTSFSHEYKESDWFSNSNWRVASEISKFLYMSHPTLMLFGATASLKEISRKCESRVQSYFHDPVVQ